MSEGDWISLTIVGVCVLMSAPGIVIAFLTSAWRGVFVNAVIYLVVGTAIPMSLLVQNKLDHGTWGPKSWPYIEMGYTLMAVVGLGIYCLIFLLIGIPVATMLRRRRQGRKPRGLEPKSAAKGGHRE